MRTKFTLTKRKCLKKMHFHDHELTGTGKKKRYGRTMIIVVFSCINFELYSLKQTILNK